MNKLQLLVLIIAMTILSSCSPTVKTGTANNTDDTKKGTATGLNSIKVSRFRVQDLNAKYLAADDQYEEYSNPRMIDELLSFMDNQKYIKTGEKCDMDYKAELFDQNGELILVVNFGSVYIGFDRDAAMDKSVFKKGTYRVENWVEPYLKALYEGKVLDPGFISYPSTLKLPDESYTLQIVDKGSGKVNLYGVYPLLYVFISTNFAYKEFEIIESKKYYDLESLEEEISKTEADESCIELQYSDSGACLDIESGNDYEEAGRCSNIIISKSPKVSNIYKLITDSMVFHIRVKSDFDSLFQAVFNTNNSVIKTVTPEEIKKLFDEKKPYFMEYVTKNLGIEDFIGRQPENLSIKQIKLDNNADPYTVLSISNPYNVRLLIFKKNPNKVYQFIDYIDFGGHVAGTDYKIENIGDEIFVTGNICKGYGTGVSKYCKVWYTVNDQGKKLVLSFPYDDYSVNTWGGYTMHGDMKINRGSEISISVNYNINKMYLIDLDIANNEGFIEISGRSTIVFKWDNAASIFKSECTEDEDGAFIIPVKNPNITKKCDGILGKYHDKLLGIINSISGEQNEFTRYAKIEGINTFLDDCTDSEKKAYVGKRLNDIK